MLYHDAGLSDLSSRRWVRNPTSASRGLPDPQPPLMPLRHSHRNMDQYGDSGAISPLCFQSIQISYGTFLVPSLFSQPPGGSLTGPPPFF